MLQESVVAIVPEELVRDVLPVIHRSALGHLARLVRAGKQPVLAQLQRAGVPITQAPEHLANCPAVLLMSAAARSPMTASLLLQHGATSVWVISTLGAWNMVEDVIIDQPNMHTLPPHPAQRIPGRSPNQAVRSVPPPQPDAGQADQA